MRAKLVKESLNEDLGAIDIIGLATAATLIVSSFIPGVGDMFNRTVKKIERGLTKMMVKKDEWDNIVEGWDKMKIDTILDKLYANPEFQELIDELESYDHLAFKNPKRSKARNELKRYVDKILTPQEKKYLHRLVAILDKEGQKFPKVK